jgi:3-isopropylmalate dehydrogenase
MEAVITILPGDGVGPDVSAAAKQVLDAVAEKYRHTFNYHEALIGGAAIDATGDPLPPATIEKCAASDAVLLGAVGGPKWSDPNAKVRPEQGLLKIRSVLGVYANIRPVKIYSQLTGASPLKRRILKDVDLRGDRANCAGCGKSGRGQARQAVFGG